VLPTLERALQTLADVVLHLRSVAYSLHIELLRKAAELLGGSARLGRELQVPARNLGRWMTGLEPMPRPMFLKVVDLIIALTSEPAEAPAAPKAQRASDAPARSRAG